MTRPDVGLHVIVVGAGFTGTMLAVQLLERTGARVTLIERDPPRTAAGTAFATPDAAHVLNVPAAKMSAWPDRPDDFAGWLARHDEGDGATFARRSSFGQYLREIFERSKAEHGARLGVVADEAIDLTERATGARLRLRGGRTIEADAAVLACGNLPPHDRAGLCDADLPEGRYISNPWRFGWLDALDGGEAILLVGSGLTAVDTAISLDARGHRGPIVALSRRGLLPRSHTMDGAGQANCPPVEGATLSHALRAVREIARAAPWRAAIDALRPISQRLWAGWSAEQRARFIRHLRPWWDVHRHRIAPAVGARIEAMLARGALELVAGKIVSIEAERAGALVAWRIRGEEGVTRGPFDRIVNCTGPANDVRRTTDPLLAAMVAAGAIRPDPIAIGIDTDAELRVIGRDGRVSPRIRCVGPMTRPYLWEVVAVPDLRRQVAELADRIAGQLM